MDEGHPSLEWKSGAMTLPQAAKVLQDDLRMCGCGMPEAVAALVLSVLDAYDGDGHEDSTLGNYDKLGALMPNDGVYYFVLYQLCFDDVLLAEHGSGVPGWLTDKGIAFRDALHFFGAEAVAEAQIDYATGTTWGEPEPTTH